MLTCGKLLFFLSHVSRLQAINLSVKQSKANNKFSCDIHFNLHYEYGWVKQMSDVRKATHRARERKGLGNLIAGTNKVLMCYAFQHDDETTQPASMICCMQTWKNHSSKMPQSEKAIVASLSLHCYCATPYFHHRSSPCTSKHTRKDTDTDTHHIIFNLHQFSHYANSKSGCEYRVQ